MRYWAAFLTVIAHPVHADIQQISHGALTKAPHFVEDFEHLPVLPEPGHILPAPHQAKRLNLSRSFAGQRHTLLADFQGLGGRPTRPPEPAADGDLAIAWHPGLGSNALFPVGRDGADRASGRGEGPLAVGFGQEIRRFGLTIHAGYDDPLGARPQPGKARIIAYDKLGSIEGRIWIDLTTGPLPLAFETENPVVGFTVENIDFGGIAVDDLIIELPDVTG